MSPAKGQVGPSWEVRCPCGEAVRVTPGKLGRKKYCSQACKYRYRVRPSGLRYELKVENSSWFKAGEARFRGEDHPSWKGEDVGYSELHRWVRRSKAKSGRCERCSREGYTEWANCSREYRRDLGDWVEMCKLCHRRYDSGEFWGVATAKFGKSGMRGLRA